ncbi:MAG: DUF2071 domain-containing protein [Acidobacteriota bacterium]
MHLRTKARDCLYLNWALPRDAVPELPEPLDYELHPWRGGDWVFVSVLLFRFSGLHAANLPLVRLSYPQMSLRLYVLDEDRLPSALFLRTMVPFWVAPVSRLVGRQPAAPGRFTYPSPSSGGDSWTWRLRSAAALEVTASLASPAVGDGPDLGSWDSTVDYFRRRRRGYVLWDGGALRSITRSHPSVAVWPLRVEVTASGLLSEVFPASTDAHWRGLHSAWLCPEIPFSFEVGEPQLAAMTARGRMVSPVVDGC